MRWKERQKLEEKQINKFNTVNTLAYIRPHIGKVQSPNTIITTNNYKQTKNASLGFILWSLLYFVVDLNYFAKSSTHRQGNCKILSEKLAVAFFSICSVSTICFRRCLHAVGSSFILSLDYLFLFSHGISICLILRIR